MSGRRVCWLSLGVLILVPYPNFAQTPTDRTVILLGGLSDSDLLVVSAAFAGRHPGVMLLDSPYAEAVIKPFLTRFNPDRIVAIGEFPGGIDAVKRRWGIDRGLVTGVSQEPAEYARSRLRDAGRVVVCPEHPAGTLVQAACLAGALPAPLFVARDPATPPAGLTTFVRENRVTEVIAVGSAAATCRRLPDVRVTELPDAAVAAAHRSALREAGPINGLVLANSSDPRLAPLAPWVALRQRAALVLTRPDGLDAGDRVRTALAEPDLAAAETLTIVGDPRAIPTEHRPNPVSGKDATIQMEPGTPPDGEPFTLATGRLFHPDRAIIPLVLARPRLMTAPRRALIASNPGGKLPLLETFSRTTARELANAGYTVTTRFHRQVQPVDLRRQLPEADLFLWEGHYKTLVEKFGFSTWTEPLPPAVVVLQSCMALNETEAEPLFNRGAVAVVGSATRTYSASGGAFTLAFFDGLAYEDQSLGGAVRQGKNFLACYGRLKRNRLGTASKLDGVNVRSSWAFTLWGDPTLTLPRPARPADARTPLTHTVDGDTITLKLPGRSYDPVEVPPYRATAWPNGRLAGLVTSKDVDDKRLDPFAFAEVHLPNPPPGRTPRLTSRVPESRWLFQWDARRRRGYLLVLPKDKDGTEVRFNVAWQ